MRGGEETGGGLHSKNLDVRTTFVMFLPQGDSGGPLTVERRESHTLVGIVSHGNLPCAQVGKNALI